MPHPLAIDFKDAQAQIRRSRDAEIRKHDFAAKFFCTRQYMRPFQCAERDRHIRENRRPFRFPCIGRDAARDIDRHHHRVVSIHDFHQFCFFAGDLARKPGPNQSIHDDIRLGDIRCRLDGFMNLDNRNPHPIHAEKIRSRRAADSLGISVQKHLYKNARIFQNARAHKAVAAVISRPTHDDDHLVSRFQTIQNNIGHRRPGRLHERRLRQSEIVLCDRLQMSHFLRRHDVCYRTHVSLPSPRPPPPCLFHGSATKKYPSHRAPPLFPKALRSKRAAARRRYQKKQKRPAKKRRR